MKVFITGGTGLVGSHVAERLRRRGDEVVALVRPEADSGHLRRIGAAVVTGVLPGGEEELVRAMRGCDALVHAAAIVYRRVAPEEYRRVNVEGTERVIRAAARAGLGRAVHVSSIAVFGVVRRPVEEADWLAHRIDPHNIYAATKRESEQAAWRLHEAGLIPVTTVRPGVIYGERDRLFTGILARAARLPVVPLPGGGRTTIPVVYAGNVAAGIIAALDRPTAAGRAYSLSGDAGLTASGLLRAFAQGLDRRCRIVAAPAAPTRVLAAALDSLRGLLPAAAGTGLKRAAWLLLHDNPYLDRRARAELDWDDLREPPHAALRRTAAWWNTHGTRRMRA